MQLERIRLVAYEPRHAARWNAFVRTSKNGTFLFERPFMDYHAARFTDASLLAFEGSDESNLIALLPANRDGLDLITHGGLSYGGWITDRRMTTPGMIELFNRLREFAGTVDLRRLVYKVIPRCYHRMPAEEDLYALVLTGARLVRQDVTSVIDLTVPLAWSKGRRHGLSKSRAAGVKVDRSDDFADFSVVLRETLAAHDAGPVHSREELELLAGRFPELIRLYAATLHGAAIAYALTFDTGQTVHTQYLATREAGRAAGALEAIVHRLQHEDYAGHRYLSFGISTERGGQVLNRGLIAQKEMFGARAMVCSFFELDWA